MNSEYLVEKIGAVKNEMSHIWGGVFVTGGGSITLATTGLNALKWTFIILGVLLTILFINAYITKRIELMSFLKELKEDN